MNNRMLIAIAIVVVLIIWAIIKNINTKRRYKKLIEEQRNTLTPEALNDQWWLDRTHVYITTIFGNHTKSLALPMYGSFYKLQPDLIEAKRSVTRLNELFDVYKDMIDKGLYYKKNILSDYSTPEISIGFLAIVVAILISISEMYYNNGYSAGQSFTECKLLDCENDKQTIVDSLSTTIRNQRQENKDQENNEKSNIEIVK